MAWNPFRRRDRSHRFFAGLFGGSTPGVGAAQQSTAFASESEDENLGVRSLSGGSQLELTEGERLRALRLSRRLYYRNGIYGQLVDLFVSWILGDGVALKHRDEETNGKLQAVLDDPQNRFHDRLADRVTRWLVDGELPFTFLVPYREQPLRESSGAIAKDERPNLAARIFFGRADPLSIGELRVDALDVDTIRELVIQPIDGEVLAGGLQRKPLPIGRVGIPPADTGVGAAAVQLWRFNPLGLRGLPMLARIIDKADVLDRVVQGLADKVELTNRFLFHVKYEKTGDKEADEAFEKKVHGWISKASGGESCVTPNTVEIGAIAPDLKMPETQEAYEVALDWNLGSVGVPRHWFASGGETNRATSVEQGSPIHRIIRKRQSELSKIVHELGAYVVYLLKLAGDVPEGIDEHDLDVTMAEAATRDSMRETEQLTALSLAVRDLSEARAITPAEGRKMLRRQIEQLPLGEVLDDDPPDVDENEPIGGGGVPASGGARPALLPGPGSDGPAASDAVSGAAAATGAAPSRGGDAAAAARGAATGAAAVADTALNGAQVASAVEIATLVADGKLPAATAKALLLAAFPAWTPAEVDAIVNPAEAFEPTPDPAPTIVAPGGRPPPPKDGEAGAPPASEKPEPPKPRPE